MVYAQTPVFPLVGNATSLGGDCYQLTPADDYMHGAVWFQQQLNLTQPFDIRVTFNFGNTHAWLTGCANPANCADPTYVYPQEGGGADGIAFLLQQQGSGAGSTGSGIG